MRTNNSFGIHFILRLNKLRDGNAPIYARISVDGRRIELSLKRVIDPKVWNTKKGTAIGSRENAKELNHYLDRVRSRLMTCYQELQLENTLITSGTIKNKFLGIDQEKYSLCKLISYHNSTMSEVLAPGTQKNYFTTQKYVQQFLKNELKKDDVYLSSLKYKFIVDFELFLRRHQPTDHQRPLHTNGVMKHIERLRKIIKLGIKLEWLEKDPFAYYKQKFDKVEREFLTSAELDRVELKEFKANRLQLVKDLFVFSCYTGLAYADLMQLQPADITLGIDGEYWIIAKRQKTNEPFRIPLLPKPLRLIHEYQNNPRSIVNQTVFPRMSNQKLNCYLKEIADLCGIQKNLTFHLARHTFATTITLTNGVPIESISKMLGHSKISTTQIYAKVIEKKVSDDMRDLRSKLEKQVTRKQFL